MLTLDEFYSPAVKQGLVRSPVEFVVALLVATGRRSSTATPLWLMEGMGQRPLFPPNVSGWKHNGYWVNASAMAKRTETVRSMVWRSMQGYWNGDGLIHLKNGTIARDDVTETWAGPAVEGARRDPPADRHHADAGDRMPRSPHSRQASARWERSDLFHLVMFSPELQVA